MKGVIKFGFFSDVFNVDPILLDRYGALDISLCHDLEAFLDPFLLYFWQDAIGLNAQREIDKYLLFLWEQSRARVANPLALDYYYTFKEVKQNWLGYTFMGNEGRGWGHATAQKLHTKLSSTPNFLKLSPDQRLGQALACKGIGPDLTSDFTVNLSKSYLLQFTEKFAKNFIDPKFCSKCEVSKVTFNYKHLTWKSKKFTLPIYKNDYVMLTPVNILNRVQPWIHPSQLNTKVTDPKFSDLYNSYIDYKKETSNRAIRSNEETTRYMRKLFINNIRVFISKLDDQTDFYSITGRGYPSVIKRLQIFKDFIENKNGWEFFYFENQAIGNESDIALIYQLIACNLESSTDQTGKDGIGIIFKLAKNPNLKYFFQNRIEEFKNAGGQIHKVFVIFCFTLEEHSRLLKILHDLEIRKRKNMFIIRVDKPL